MTPSSPQSPEDKALAALVTATLHPWDHEVTLEDIAPYLCNDVVLSSDAETALATVKDRLFTDIEAHGECTEEEGNATMAAMLALHRKKPVGGFCNETEEEIQRRKQELLLKLEEKRRNCAP